MAIGCQDTSRRRTGPATDGSHGTALGAATIASTQGVRCREDVVRPATPLPAVLSPVEALPSVSGLPVRPQGGVIGGRPDGLDAVPAAHGGRLGPLPIACTTQSDTAPVRVDRVRLVIEPGPRRSGARDARHSRNMRQATGLAASRKVVGRPRATAEGLTTNGPTAEVENEEAIAVGLDGPSPRMVAAHGEGKGRKARAELPLLNTRDAPANGRRVAGGSDAPVRGVAAVGRSAVAPHLDAIPSEAKGDAGTTAGPLLRRPRSVAA